MFDFTDQARVVLYKGEDPVKELKFNAKDSDNEHWFKYDRLTENPWTDMNSQPLNLFTIETQFERSFIINSQYGGCPNDSGWLVITGYPCDWEKHFGEHAVLYSNLSGRTNWNSYGK